MAVCTFLVLQLLLWTVAADNDNKAEDPYLWIKLHGWLMWGSFGTLIPLGTLIIRFSRSLRKRESTSKKAEKIFNAHLCVQAVGFLMSAGGGVISFMKLSNGFLHTHQRLGLALWALAWLQPFIGLVRPKKGHKARAVWYVIHWLLGTFTMILGIYNVYSGMRIFELITQRSKRTLNILFSLQISVMALVYLLQDKWKYLREQWGSANKPVTQPMMVRQYSVSSHRKYYTTH